MPEKSSPAASALVKYRAEKASNSPATSTEYVGNRSCQWSNLGASLPIESNSVVTLLSPRYSSGPNSNGTLNIAALGLTSINAFSPSSLLCPYVLRGFVAASSA
eukprot:CAMPEP_0169268182 /NCGR_PEP_ID=MMETSP1016-20121227/47638_1 /TAXON_ID=342587 /ORGANISM="Karlodinium micrum, Strain CCMP2283" /LENGTH=103 /DNA_ID=CAMNT_0009352825 /DNA_START=327 /DNA_END=638 /DNA_ORIENTATION=-